MGLGLLRAQRFAAAMQQAKVGCALEQAKKVLGRMVGVVDPQCALLVDAMF